MILRIISVLCLLFLGACQSAKPTYLYVPPMDAKARACIEECEDTLETCQYNADQTYEACKQNAVFLEDVYEDCLKGRKVIGQEGSCRRPNPCPPPTYEACAKEFDACYVACGGSVVPK
jgi:hypothetical protein